MTRKNRPLLTPAIAVGAGSTVAIAAGIHQGWPYALAVEAVVVGWAAMLYGIGQEDSDMGAVLRQRDDERQQLVALKAARFSHLVVGFSLCAACLIAAAENAAIWPFEVLATILGVAYVVGLRIYGMRNETPTPNEAGARTYSLIGFRREHSAR
jgi:hypothetical protein